MIVLGAVPDGTVALAVGTVLALGALAFVLSPLFGDFSKTDAAAEENSRERSAADSANNVTVNGAVAALRDIEFDRETGKLSDRDYADLKRGHTQAAIDEIRAAKSAANESVTEPVTESVTASASLPELSDLVEAAIARAHARQQSCAECGPRPEPDATYCSNCGGYLARFCGECGSAVEMASSHFCSNCGEPLAVV